ncbi:unnamed protein product [Blepharisma stoltei]|uniref:Calmodulin n=1 Tax=Blepharisma stoltei TaxID=1481888 RepID=A0AAU9ILK9_9CILI|nr:unnamed protein product [Blepharisma stoltei]
MCRSSLSSFKMRTKLKPSFPEGSKTERRKLKRIFKELSKRCSLSDDGINRDQFLKFTDLSGLLGEQLFNSLDEDEDGKLDVKEFLNGLILLYKGTFEEISEILFKIFDFSKSSHISSNDILFILSYLPKFCPKCKKRLVVAWDFKEKIQELFEDREYIHLEEFKESIEIKNEIGELIFQCIFNSLPVVIDECFLQKKLICENLENFTEGKLIYNSRDYYFLLKNKSLYFAPSKDKLVNNPVGVIYVNDLFVEGSEGNRFILKNSKFEYTFEAENLEQKEKWIGAIKSETGFKEFYIDYETTETIGKGAYGEVKLGTNKHTGNTVAVKIISKEPLDARSETRLRREINILKIIKHESILRLESVYETANELFIVTDYISGGSLFTWLKDREFSIAEIIARKIIKDLANALLFLHTNGIIHRDLKLENILIETDKNGVVKPILIDFGLSCMLAPHQCSQESVGTLKYAAPEVLSRIPYRESVDLWGLGVISYILLIGRMPFYGKNDQDIATRILKKPIDLEGENFRHISQGAKEIIKGLLTRRPANRMSLNALLEHEWVLQEDEGRTDKITAD